MSPPDAKQQKSKSRPGGHPGHELADVRSGGELLVRVDQTQADDLLRRGLIEPRGRRHFRALDPAAVRLWARSRVGGSFTTIGPQERSWHRALKGMLAGV
jgi:hypothetical protein